MHNIHIYNLLNKYSFQYLPHNLPKQPEYPHKSPKYPEISRENKIIIFI